MLKDDILEKIKSGQYKRGQKIPSEEKLAKTWHISRMTVRRALDELAREGVLYKTKGSGTFVESSRVLQQDVMNFSKIAELKGVKASTVVLKKEFMCRDDIARALHLPKGTVFYSFARLRKIDDVPIGIENVFLPIQIYLQPDRIDLTASLYENLKNLYGVEVSRQDISVTAKKPTADESRLLALKKNDAVLKTSGVSLDSQGSPLFYEENTYSGESYIMHVSIKSRVVDI